MPPRTYPHMPGNPPSRPDAWWKRMEAVPGSKGLALVPMTPWPRYGDLQAFVAEIVLDELGHGPVEEHGAGFLIVAEPQLRSARVWAHRRSRDRLRPAGRKSIAEPANDVAHGVPALHIVGGERADFGFAAFVVIPELNAGAIEEGNEEAVDGGGPLKAATGQVEFFDDERVQQSGKIGAGRHAHAGEGLFDGAGAADAGAALDDQHALAGACEIGCAGQAVVAGADDDHVPGFRAASSRMGTGKPISPRTAAVGELMQGLR